MSATADREAWLYKVAAEFEPKFAAMGSTLTAYHQGNETSLRQYRIGVGFASTGRKSKRIGECHDSMASGDQTHEIIIVPAIADSIQVAATLVHEMAHIAAGLEAKHGPGFKRVCSKLDLLPPYKATTPGEELTTQIQDIVARIGEYPHASLTSGGKSTGPKEQKGRMLKASCPECEYIIRLSKSCIEIGLPPCPNPECNRSYIYCLVHNLPIMPMESEYTPDKEQQDAPEESGD